MSEGVVRCTNCETLRPSRLEPREIRLRARIECRTCGHTTFAEVAGTETS